MISAVASELAAKGMGSGEIRRAILSDELSEAIEYLGEFRQTRQERVLSRMVMGEYLRAESVG